MLSKIISVLFKKTPVRIYFFVYFLIPHISFNIKALLSVRINK